MSLNKRLFTGGPPPVYNFGVTTYTGNGGTNSITTGFQSDLVFLRNSDTTSAYATGVFDSNRGATKWVNATNVNAQVTESNSLTSFDSGGFTLGNGGDFNANGGTFNSFSLKANGGTTSTNSNGSINSTVQTNSDAGFSIVSYTGTGSAGTVGHGLSSTPQMIIFKKTDVSGWKVYNENLTNPTTSTYELNDRTAQYSPAGGGGLFNSTAPTSSVFSVGNYADTNSSGGAVTAYAFHSVSGYSKLGKYTGNASSNAITVGFLPKFLMIKKISASGTMFIYLASGMTAQSYGYSGNSGMTLSGSTATLPSIEFRSDNGGQFVLSGSDYNLNANNQTFVYYCVGGDLTNVL